MFPAPATLILIPSSIPAGIRILCVANSATRAALARARAPHTTTYRTLLDGLYIHLTFYAGSCLPECNLYFNFSIAPVAGSAGASKERASRGAAEAISKKGLEDILEAAERVGRTPCTGPRSGNLVAIRVVGAARLRIREYFVGFGELLEAFFGTGVIRVGVGVM